MSDDVLSVIPTDPNRQPDRVAAERAAAIVADLAPGLPDGVEVEIDVEWYDVVTVVACDANPERIGCPHCAGSIDADWWADLLEEHADGEFGSVVVRVPCCGATTSPARLDFDRTCGFARFEIAVWNPERMWFDDEEMAMLADALECPVRQVRAHI
ncbi:hypothetical protein [Embleya sp. NPDC050493]|uniref:hypothetical protein n=1 Tax=Embleya sp. NPDC050493 TaxID=3363989 RepID=UPI00378DDE98